MLTPDTFLTAYDLGLEELNPYISAEVDAEGVTLRWVELLDFHARRHPELFEESEDPDADDDDPDAPRWLTDAALAALSELARWRWAGATADEGGDADPHVVISWWIPGQWTLDALSEHAYDLCAPVANETDPGTFGSPYIFDLVAERLRQ